MGCRPPENHGKIKAVNTMHRQHAALRDPDGTERSRAGTCADVEAAGGGGPADERGDRAHERADPGVGDAHHLERRVDRLRTGLWLAAPQRCRRGVRLCDAGFTGL